jgi:hypothetical protein
MCEGKEGRGGGGWLRKGRACGGGGSRWSVVRVWLGCGGSVRGVPGFVLFDIVCVCVCVFEGRTGRHIL